jgi:hypothetical protein
MFSNIKEADEKVSAFIKMLFTLHRMGMISKDKVKRAILIVNIIYLADFIVEPSEVPASVFIDEDLL